MSPTFSNLFRAVIVLLLTAHVFCMYSLARSMSGDFGLDVGTAVLAALFALVLLVPLVWAVAVPDAPEMYLRVLRARKWRTEGRCPECGYRCGAEQTVCSECGTALRAPAEYRITGGTVRRYLVMNLLAWVVGCGVAETGIRADESMFRRETARFAAEGDEQYSRPRRWPARGIFAWDAETGYAVAY